METRPLWRARVRAALVDELLIAVIGLVVFAMAVQTGAAAIGAVALGGLVGPLDGREGAVVGVLAVLVWLAVRLLYGVLAEGGPRAATPGKRVTGLAVGGPDGLAPGYRRALVRHGVKAVLVASVAGLLAPATGHCWHDRLARTRVEQAGVPRRHAGAPPRR